MAYRCCVSDTCMHCYSLHRGSWSSDIGKAHDEPLSKSHQLAFEILSHRTRLWSPHNRDLQRCVCYMKFPIAVQESYPYVINFRFEILSSLKGSCLNGGVWITCNSEKPTPPIKLENSVQLVWLEYFVVTRYGQADIAREVSGRRADRRNGSCQRSRSLVITTSGNF